MTNQTRKRFSRFNQPKVCRGCGKKTTWSEGNGYWGLDLCRDCFERATLENDHWDNGHETPKAGCPVCAQAQEVR